MVPGADITGCISPTDARVMEAPRPPDPLQNGQPLLSGISILDRLIKTCPVWLQLCMGAQQVVEMLCREAAGVFLVTRDVDVGCMVLWVRSSETADLLHYNIREEKTMLCLDGSMLVFKDIFKLVAFYCVSRDILPSVLKLPPAISSAQSLQDLEEISNLGTGFWTSALRDKFSSTSQSAKSTPPGNLRSNNIGCVQEGSGEFSDCTCEIEISVGNDRLWFVSPIFIEECSNTNSSEKLPLPHCTAKPDIQWPKVMHRRPPPPPPPPVLHKPPLPSVPPSAPPSNYICSDFASHALNSPTWSSPSISERKSPTPEPPPTETPAKPPLSGTPIVSAASETPAPCCQPELSPSQSLCPPPTTSIPNLVDLLDCSSLIDHPTRSPPSGPPPVSSPDLLSLSDSSLDSSLPSQSESTLLSFTSQATDKKVPQTKESPVSSGDVDLLKEPLKNMKINVFENSSPPQQVRQTLSPVRVPPAVPRRRQSSKVLENVASSNVVKDEVGARPSSRQVTEKSATLGSKSGTLMEQPRAVVENGKKTCPVPPPRKKKLSGRSSSVPPDKGKSDGKRVLEMEKVSKNSESKFGVVKGKISQKKRLSSPMHRASKPPLPSHGSEQSLPNPEADSYSTSSADEDSEPPTSASIKKSHSFMLDRAKNRLSIVAITHVFSAFMSADRKLQKKITELAHDKASYFGNLVQDYKAYSLEMMAKQSSSTEMLQEIRLMMTQLKSYLVQSTELKSMVDYTLYTDDKIEAIVEAALCKCVLKPLKSAIECYLREIHNKDGSLRLLTENQQVIQETTTTELGVTTSVPDSSVMEKILHKFGTMHKTYSPEKKISYLLKACKLIYDSMAAGNPGKHHGADDFLPVLMYVLAQCDLVSLLLDVEYMMELMDPALQLGEGSYYLTTTYGALEHIKNYDKITVTRHLSLEVQDSIHRWERRRTLNKAKVSRSSIQDFITISFEESNSQTRTLATKPDTSVAEVAKQCAEKFEVSQGKNYGLFVQVNERCIRLSEDAFPQQVKSQLLKNEQKLDFHFVYRQRSAQDTVLSELNLL
ncbi:ras and Rab interactor 3 isoform X2 [Dendrobates tinctorius]|uniref:ras and Rab interactor 3 isoform X2 n=1 Tax=Dendrobates tinctorius TaxID=92724 RepID=UPI003CCA5720